ncbi:MAG: transferrin-binding protein-like solute binding protein [Alysiella sp.]|uniref:transferrin-binding protein-like solute binding protein n=1 Tax=Alysiella sp. TaxID=1872483 RepID=UPI0026DD8170|nr:transferrin-binding protein-like solute binding protein [Alysiella sp.]MDO4433251.1 transferrin-binding protein-like solute binding protein [Alysiella sp.]
MLTDASNIHQITVNGITFDLARVGKTFSNGWGLYQGQLNHNDSQAPAGVSRATVWNGSNNVTVGVLSVSSNPSDKNNQHTQDFAFFNGKFTDINQIPQHGSIKYDIRAAHHTYQNGNNVIQGILPPSVLTANFDTKELSGTISRESQYGGNIKATIQSNGFEPKTGESTVVKGRFFGNNATEEISGISQNNNTIGAFHGKQQ